MKIKPGHIDALKKAIAEVFDNNGGIDKVKAIYESGKFPRSEKVQDLQKRFCFDLLHFAQVPGLINDIYLYANDSHIYTALKKVCPAITKQY